jgi:hypothetical protein
MSEVKRYYTSLDHGTYAEPKYDCIDEVVKASDFDAAQSELSALREELVVTDKEVEGLQSALADAEQRNADAVRKMETALTMLDDDDRGNNFRRVLRVVVDTLQPTESGASK